MFISEYFNVEVSEYGVFDALLDKDSNFFINVIRKKSHCARICRSIFPCE